MTDYLIRKSKKGNYLLLKPQNTRNPHKDVGRWRSVLSVPDFEEFYSTLCGTYLPKVCEDDAIHYDTLTPLAITQDEKEKIERAVSMFKGINDVRSTLTRGLDKLDTLEQRL